MDRIYIGVITVLVIACIGMFIDNTRLEAKVANMTTELVVSQTNEFKAKKEIEIQNEAITKLAVDKAAMDKKYLEQLNKPEKVRFEKVYVKVPNIEVKSNECDDIKKLIDNIRSTGY